MRRFVSVWIVTLGLVFSLGGIGCAPAETPAPSEESETSEDAETPASEEEEEEEEEEE